MIARRLLKSGTAHLQKKLIANPDSVTTIGISFLPKSRIGLYFRSSPIHSDTRNFAQFHSYCTHLTEHREREAPPWRCCFRGPGHFTRSRALIRGLSTTRPSNV